MASQQCLPPGHRYLKSISHGKKLSEAGVEAEKAERQDEALRLGRDALQVNDEVQRHLPAPQTPQRPQRLSRSGGRTISELDSDSVTPEASRPAPLPTPSTSPVTSKNPIKTASAIPPASTTESQDIAHLHTFLQDCQRKIHSLDLELDATKREVQRFRDERREASREHLRAVRRNAEKEIEGYKTKEERLTRMVEEKEQTIERLEKQIDEGRERERELRGRLTEAKRRAEEEEERLREAERRAEEGEERLREAKRGVGGGEHAEVEGKGKGKSKGMSGKRGGARAGKTGWEFRRRKGEGQTPSEALYQTLFKRGTP